MSPSSPLDDFSEAIYEIDEIDEEDTKMLHRFSPHESDSKEIHISPRDLSGHDLMRLTTQQPGQSQFGDESPR